MAGVESDSCHTACAYIGDAPGSTSEVGGVDAASGHNDHVLGAAADHDVDRTAAPGSTLSLPHRNKVLALPRVMRAAPGDGPRQ